MNLFFNRIDKLKKKFNSYPVWYFVKYELEFLYSVATPLIIKLAIAPRTY